MSDEELHGLELLKFPLKESLCVFNNLCLLLAAQWERFSGPPRDCGENGAAQSREVIPVPRRNPVPGNSKWHCSGRGMGEQGWALSLSLQALAACAAQDQTPDMWGVQFVSCLFS